MKMYSSGELARTVGVNVETIRYYERRGLLSSASRRSSGYRMFTETDVRRLTFIRSAKGLGFTLSEIAKLLSMIEDPATRCADMRELAIEKLHHIERQISELTAMKQQLESLTDRRCPETAHPATCSMLPPNVVVPIH